MQISSLHPAHHPPFSMKLPFALSLVSAGFPSPAADHMESSLDLNQLVIQHPNSTFFVRVQGDSMKGAGICSGDILVVDRSRRPRSNDVVLAVLHGEFTVKRLVRESTGCTLVAENESYPNIRITPETDFEVWGVVTHAVHCLS